MRAAPPPSTEKRFVVTSETQDRGGSLGMARRVITFSAGDPDGYGRYMPESDVDACIHHMRGQGYEVEDLRAAGHPEPDSSDTSHPSDPTGAPVDREDLHRRLREASDAFGGSYGLAANMDLDLGLVRSALAETRSLGDDPAAMFDAKLAELGFPPAPPAEVPSPEVLEYATPYTNPADGLPLVISQGIGGDGPWMVFRRHDRSLKRISTPALPERATPEECRRDLDEWMTKKGWRAPDPPADPEAPRSEVEQAPSAPVLRRVAPGDIITDGGTQARADMSDDTVDEYADEMRAGVVFPPIVVFQDPEENLWLAAGFHRVEAALRAGIQAITAEVRPGTRRDAVLYSCGENSEHGLRRTNADKRNAVRMVLEDEEWRGWSAERIGQVCRVCGDLVLKMKREMGLTSDIGGKVTYERAGTVSTMDTAGMARGQEPQAPPPSAAPAAPAPAIGAAERGGASLAPSAQPSSASYPSDRERAPAPAQPGPRLPEPRGEDDHTPTATARQFARACYGAILHVRDDDRSKREQAIVAVMEQHFQDAMETAVKAALADRK